MSLMLIWLLACAPERCQANGSALGTSWQVTWRAERCDAVVETEVMELLQDIDAGLGVHSRDSELKRIRESFGPVRVGESTYGLVRLAMDVAAASGGAFDPTIEPVIRAWGFHSERPTTPTDEALAAMVGLVGWERVELGRTAQGVPWIDRNGRSLDLSGLIEGHAADRVSSRLVQRGIGDHVVTVGDEVRVGGSGPDGAWLVGLDVAPHEPGANLVLRLAGGGMASAGAARVQVDGEWLPKTLDPTTGRPVRTDIVRAVVVAPTTTEADALATAWVAMGSTRGLTMIESRHDVEGLIYVDGQRLPVESSGIGSWIVGDPSGPVGWTDVGAD